MSRNNNRFVIYIFFLLVACKPSPPEALPFYNSAELEPEWIPISDSRFTRIHKVGPFSFIDQDSLTITNRDFDGHIYVTDFFFTTCPSICPKMTDNMLSLQDKYRDREELKFLSHTVTPWIDDVARLKAYAEEKGVMSGKWHLVTGNEEVIYKQARLSYFVEGLIGIQREDDFLHTENFVLVDAKRRIRGLYSGTSKKDMKRLIRDIDVLLEQ